MIVGSKEYVTISGRVNDIKSMKNHSLCESEIFSARKSGFIDKIKLCFEKDLVIEPNSFIKIKGHFVFLNGHLYVVAEKLLFSSRIEKEYRLKIPQDENTVINFQSTIVKYPQIRITSNSNVLMDVILSLDKETKSVIPCILFESCVHVGQNLCRGDDIIVSGRIQSREYYSARADCDFDTTELAVNKLTICNYKGTFAFLNKHGQIVKVKKGVD